MLLKFTDCDKNRDGVKQTLYVFPDAILWIDLVDMQYRDRKDIARIHLAGGNTRLYVDCPDLEAMALMISKAKGFE